ncbi:MAG TPA: four-carbon acid sugar kinase family protein [Oculatellaceae cyanobacterium]|jgi:uncharacterized protein YgbK (DUF1537 family)
MQLPGLSVGIIADDLTGACDTALQFFSGKNQVRVLLDPQKYPAEDVSHPSESQIWSINTASRHHAPYEAHTAVRQAVALLRDKFGIETFYKKMDSTLRGNIAQECLGMLDELKAQCAVIVPAYPQEGRRTVGGYQLVRGIPVEKTVVARDPLFPVRQSHLPTLLEQASRPEIVGYIPLSVVLHGAGPILVKLNELIKEGKKLVVVDATSTEDLEQIALAIEKGQKNASIIPCGSAGLAQALARLWENCPDEGVAEAPEEVPIILPASPILIVSGSNTDTTRQQILRLMEHYPYYGQNSQLEVFELPPEQLLGVSPVNVLIQSIVQALGERNTVVLSTGIQEENYPHTLALAREHELPEERVSQLVQDALARIVSGVMMQRQAKLVLAGGETTSTICQALDTYFLEIVAEAEPSIPLCQDNKGRWLVTKSGGFGGPLALANVVKYIKQRESSSVHA